MKHDISVHKRPISLKYVISVSKYVNMERIRDVTKVVVEALGFPHCVSRGIFRITVREACALHIG